jgi:hypothetical protein
LPLDTRSLGRLGLTGAVSQIVGLIDGAEISLPPRSASAIHRWRVLTATVANYSIFDPTPAQQAARTALLDAAEAEADSIDVDALLGKGKVFEAIHRRDRAQLHKQLLTEAVSDAATGVLGSVGQDEATIISLAQARYAGLAKTLVDAATQLPEGFAERDSVYASDELRQHWTTATRTWDAMLRVRALIGAFDTLADLDPDWANVAWTKSDRVANATLFRTGECEFGDPGSITFALNLARACAADPAELWAPTTRQASDLAIRLWHGGLPTFKIAG